MSVVLPEIYAVAAVGGRWVMVAVDDHALPGGRTFERRELRPDVARLPREAAEAKQKLRRCIPRISRIATTDRPNPHPQT
jgi:hypothetical protein